MKAYIVSNPGKAEVLELKEIDIPKSLKDWVLIKVKAFGLNRSELYTRLGHSGDAVPFPRILGIECVGEVVEATDSDLKSGQKVACAMGHMGRKYDGSYAEYTLIPRSQVMPVDTNLDWETFGALPETYFTAYGSIMEDMNVKFGDQVLVRGGTSSVGMAAISILKDLGAKIIATTRKEQRKEMLLKAGANHVVIDYGVIAKKVKEIFPNGADSILELVGSRKSLEDSFQCAKEKGIVCNTGLLGNEWDFKLPELINGIKYSFHSTEKVETKIYTPILKEIIQKVECGIYNPNIYKVFDFNDLVEAHKTMEQNRAIGKIVIKVNH
ncbi:zinc-binding dehydrogenase [Bacteroidota bacterium]